MRGMRTGAALCAAAMIVGCGGGGDADGRGDGGLPDAGPTGDPRVDLAATVELPASARAGDTVTLRYRVENVGQLPTVWAGELFWGHADTDPSQLLSIGLLMYTGLVEPGQAITGERELTLPATLAGGDYQAFIRIMVAEDGHPENDTDAAVFPVEGAPCTDDAGEQDDVPADAPVLALGADLPRNFCFDQVDWGRFEARAGERFGVRLASEGAAAAVRIGGEGDLPYEPLLAVEAGEALAARFTAPADGTYHVQVASVGQAFGPGLDYRFSLLEARADPAATALYDEAWGATPVGGVARLRVDLENRGYAMTGPAPLEFVLSADDVLDPGDRRIDRQEVPPLEEDAWVYPTYDVPIPPDVAPGTWHVFAVVDPDDVLAELVEENNVSPPAALTLVEPECPGDAWEEDDRPADASAPAFGEPQARNFCDDVHDWVRFEAQAGEAFTVELEPDHRPQRLSVELRGPDGAVLLEAEESYGLVRTFTAEAAGTYLVRAGGSVGDWETYTLTLTRAWPDLTAGVMSFEGWYPGGVTRVDTAWRNLAPSPAGPFAVRLLLSADAVLDAGDLVLADVPFEGAGRDTNGGRTVDVTLPADLTPGDAWLFAQVDPDDALRELDETNNASDPWSITVQAPACAPDAAEPDDLPAQAVPLALDTPVPRNHCDDRRDWFAVQVTDGDPLAVRLDDSVGSGFDVHLYADDGATRLASAWDAVFWRADRTGTVLVCAGCENDPATSAPASYRLTAGLCPPDGHEPDDVPAEARSVEPGVPVALNFCDGSDDWLVFQAVAGGRYTVGAIAPNPDVEPRARFMDATGFPLSTGKNGELTAAVDGPVWIELDPVFGEVGLDSDYEVTLTAR